MLRVYFLGTQVKPRSQTFPNITKLNRVPKHCHSIAALYRILIFLSFFTGHVYQKTVIILGGCLIY